MKIKSELYCITDKNNKPDYRYAFESPTDAKRKINQIKNSTLGETLVVSKLKRDFFIDGINRTFINPYKKVTLKKGCWTALKVKKIAVLDTIEPKKIFKELIKAEENQFAFSRHYQPIEKKKSSRIKLPVVPNPFAQFEWETSFLHTKSFAASFAILCVMTISSIVTIQHNTTKAIADELLKTQQTSAQKIMLSQSKIMQDKEAEVSNTFDEEMNKFVIDTLRSFDNLKQEEFESVIAQMVSGSPMERMIPYIAKQDRKVAAFLVGIAKKESNFGRRVPVLDGQDCYNYWGYRGIRSRMGTGGHTCFDSPEDAVNTVANRLQDLVQSDIDTPQEMVIWKCGSACNRDSQAGKWIQDVSMYFQKVEEHKDNAPQDQS